MNEPPFATAQERLEAYARKLDQRLAEMRTSGKLTSGYSGLRGEIEERRRLLRERVSEAIRVGKFWDIVAAELRRDYSALFEDVLGFERRIDLEFAANSAPNEMSQQQNEEGASRH